MATLPFRTIPLSARGLGGIVPPEEEDDSPGLLARIGRLLDTPGRNVRELISGKDEASGEDVLRSLGIRMRNRPGKLDIADILNFGTEVALDPLNLLAGVGTLGRAGKESAKLASRISQIKGGKAALATARARNAPQEEISGILAKLSDTRRARRESVEELKRLGAARPQIIDGKKVQPPGTVPFLPEEGFAAQARAGQRGIFNIGAPFTRQAFPLVGGEIGARALGGLQKAGQVAQGTKLGQGVETLFNTDILRNPETNAVLRDDAGQLVRKNPETKFLTELFKEQKAGAGQRSAATAERLRGELETAIEGGGLERTDFLNRLTEAGGALGQPERFRARAAGLADQRLEDIGAVTQKAREARQAKNVESAGRRGLSAFSRAENLERTADLLRGGPPGIGDLLRTVAKTQRAKNLEFRTPKQLRAEGVGGPSSVRAERFDFQAQRLLADTQQIQEKILQRPLTPGELGQVQGKIDRINSVFSAESFEQLRQGAVAQEVLNALPGSGRALLEGLDEGRRSLLLREIQAGARAPGNALSSLSKNYVERVLSAEVRGYLGARGLNALRKRLVKSAEAYTTRTGSQIQRQDELLEIFTTEANEFFKTNKGLPKDIPWFEIDPSKSFAQRMFSGEASIAASELYQNLARRFGQEGGDGVSVLDFLRSGPVHRFDGENLAEITKFADHPLKRMTIPREIAAEAAQIYQKIAAPEEIEGFIRAIDKMSGFWRSAVTQFFPAFHVRNSFSDAILSWLGGGLGADTADAYLEGHKIAARAVANPANAEIQGYQRLSFLRSRQTAAGQARVGLEGGIPDAVRKAFKPKEWSKPDDITKTNPTKLTQSFQFVENGSRIGHFLAMKKRGLTDFEAAQSVRKHLLDYSEKTVFEREIASRAVFFYQWPRQVIPRILASFFDSTRRAALLTRATTRPGGEEAKGPLPEWLRRSAAIPIGTNAQGDPRFAAGVGSPFEEFNRIDPTDPAGGVVGTARGVGKSLLRNLNPFLKAPVEFLTGKDLFFDSKISRGTTAEPILGRLGIAREVTGPTGQKRFESDPEANFLLRNQPLSRFVRSASQIDNILTDFDPRTSRGEDLLKFMTGIRTSSPDETKRLRARQDSIDRRLSKLQRQGKAGEFGGFFARTVDGEKDEETQDLLKRRRQLQNLIKSLRGGE